MRVAPTFTELIVGLWGSVEGEKYENCGKRFERVEKEAPKELITERLLSVRVLTFRGVVLEAGKMPLSFDLLLSLFIKINVLRQSPQGEVDDRKQFTGEDGEFMGYGLLIWYLIQISLCLTLKP